MRRIDSMTRAAAFSLALIGMLAAATPSFAFRMIQNTSTGRVTSGSRVTCNNSGGFTHWTTANIDWYHNTANQGSGKATALRNAMASWTNVSGANHVLTYRGTTSAGWATDNRNTVLWATGNDCTGNCLALTALVLQSGQRIVETDITFNNSQTWTTNGANFDTQAVAAHEFGHALGIHHTEVSSSPFPTMRTPYFGSGGRSLEADDRAALQCSQNRYPVGSTGGVPAAPSFLSVFLEFCFGLNTVDWPTSTGATFYQLYGSSSSNFSSQFLVYSGTSTFRAISVSGTTYLRVRACNANGCGAYRVGNQPARYFSGCF